MQTQDQATAPAGADPSLPVPTGGQTGESPTGAGEGTDPSNSDTQKLGWRRQLREEYWNHERAKEFNSPSDAFQALLEAEGKLQNAVVRPGEGATEEDWKSYYQQVGVPESPDGYKLETLEGMPDEYTSVFAQRAHAANLTPEQAQALYKVNAEAWMEQQRTQQEQMSKAEADLKRDWGATYDQQREAAINVVKQFGDEDLAKDLAETPVGAGARFLRLLAKVAAAVSEDAGTAGGAPGSAGRVQYTEDGLPMLSIKGPSRQ